MGDHSTAMDTVPENWTNGTDSHYLSDYDDYFDPSFQLQQMLSQPAQVIAWIVGILGIVANLWALLAVFHVRGGLSLHYKLIASLTASDLFISLSVLLHHMRGIFIQVGHPVMYNMSYCFYMFTKALNTASLNISLLNLMAMALDHYLAILRPLHYPTMMTSVKVNIMICFLWVLAMVLGFSDFYSTAGFDLKSEDNQTLHFCKQVWLTKYQDEYTMFSIALLCFFIMVFVYGRIYMETRKHMRRTPQFQEIVKNKKALITTLLILGTFMLCWLPTSLFQIALIIQVHVDRKKVVSMQAALLVADPYLLDLLLLNSVLDPLIYAIRIREIRFAYKKLCYHCCRCCMKRPRRTASPDFNTTHCTMLLEERKNSVSSFKNLTIFCNRCIPCMRDNQTTLSKHADSNGCIQPVCNKPDCSHGYQLDCGQSEPNIQEKLSCLNHNQLPCETNGEKLSDDHLAVNDSPHLIVTKLETSK